MYSQLITRHLITQAVTHSTVGLRQSVSHPDHEYLLTTADRSKYELKRHHFYSASA